MPETIDYGSLIGQNIWLIIALLGGAFIVYHFFFKGKEKQIKRVSLEKTIIEDLDLLYKTFGIGMNLELSTGLATIGHVLGYINIFFDPTKTQFQNLNANKQLKLFVKKESEKVKSKDQNDNKEKPQFIEELYLFKACGTGRFDKILALLFDRGTKYYLIKKDLVKFNHYQVVINPYGEPDTYYKLIVYGKAAKLKIDSIAYKVALQNTLEELVNYIPKMNYLEVDIGGAIAKMREKAIIQKGMYEGQLENAENG